MKHILSILLITLFYSGVAQTSNKKRVLVIPPSRFEFVSEFSTEEIGKINGLTSAEVFVAYEKTLLTSFKGYNDENFEFVPVDAEGLLPYKRMFSYKYGKFKRKQYNAVDLKNFSEESFTKLLEKYNADFVIFITWYDIQKESFTRGGKHSKRGDYAGHYLDIDIYNLFKQQVVGTARVKAEGREPNDLELSLKLLRLKELDIAYNNFVSKVVDALNKPIDQ